MEDPAPYGNTDPERALLIALIQKLTEVTKLHKIRWYHDLLMEYRIRCEEQSPLKKLAICFSYENENADGITIYINDMPKTFTSPVDSEVWVELRKLECAISEDLNSTEAVITSIFEELDNLEQL